MSENVTIQVGDRVRFLYGVTKVTGQVKEDRGAIGVRGRRLYLVAFTLEPEFSSQIELPADELELVRDAAITDRTT